MEKSKGLIIWVVEDDPTAQRMIGESLKAHGFVPVIFSSAEKAYGALEYQAMPALIILDMLLPGMSGVDLIRLLKQNKDWEKIPVVVVSVLTRRDLSAAERDEQTNATYWVNKPFEANELMRTVEEVLTAVQ